MHLENLYANFFTYILHSKILFNICLEVSAVLILLLIFLFAQKYQNIGAQISFEGLTKDESPKKPSKLICTPNTIFLLSHHRRSI